MIKFPYGISNFQDIIKDNFYYVDRTDRISQIEETGKQLLFLRPRRFGKSLLLSMLENYYDVACAEQFETLFGNLAIGKNPTELHNKFFVLSWDFSAVSPQGEAQQIRDAMYKYLNETIRDFAKYYHEFITNEVSIYPDDALASFQSLMTAIRHTEYKLYLLIDEYDNFANELMMSGHRNSQEQYKALLYGEGAIKSLFKVIKSVSAGRGIDRVFITGVSPVVMSDITSGYNIAENIYLHSKFNDLCGFCESEIIAALKQIARECDFPTEEADKALNMMRTFYNGYCFSYEKTHLVYNPTLAIYFMKEFQDSCKYPRNMLDSNLAMDRGKLRYIAQIPEGDNFIVNAIGEEEPIVIYNLADRFGIEDMLTINKDYDFFASLLYYFGVLTMGGDTPLGEIILRIPNLVIRKLYVEQIQDMTLADFTSREDAKHSAQALYQQADMQPLCDFIEKRYFKVFSNRDYRWTNELTVKTAFLTLLFNDTFYIMDSETAIERGYADLTMILRPDMRKYKLLDILIEFKYVSLTNAGLSGDKAKNVTVDELKAMPVVKEKLSEAKGQLRQYAEILKQKYGDSLRLHSYGVVSIGFDRLVWEEIG
jgi:hypothetical protein